MAGSAVKKYEEIVSRLAREFSANNKDALTKETSRAQQDLIDRGLFNSTVKVSKLLELHYQYIDGLLDFLTNSIEKKYPEFRPTMCTKHIVQIVEKEYEKLKDKVPGWLHGSQLLDKKMLAMFEQGVISKKHKAIESLENECSLWEERWQRKMRERRRKRAVRILFVTITAILIPVLGWFVPLWLRGCDEPDELGSPGKMIRDISVDPKTGRTPLNVRTTKRVEEMKEFIIKEKIDPWLFIRIRGVQILKTDGSVIAFSGVEYQGSPRTAFLDQDYIDPFLEEGIQKVLDETGEECRTNDLRAEEPLKEAGALLAGVIRNIYNRMAEVDSRLRKKRGDSEKVSKVNIEERIKVMDKKLREHLKAALELYSDSPQ
ncbi:MAG: hypothetical protein ACFFCW_29520 [Candidatus Hodarchaeota archaeon]